jgi:hypothetical protein
MEKSYPWRVNTGSVLPGKNISLEYDDGTVIYPASSDIPGVFSLWAYIQLPIVFARRLSCTLYTAIS